MALSQGAIFRLPTVAFGEQRKVRSLCQSLDPNRHQGAKFAVLQNTPLI
jgi:hypothetical protein